jgi:putative addiction module component (TIGR02574 family)
MSPELRAAILRMTREERIDLLDDVWALVRDDALPVPASHFTELQARLGAADSDGRLGAPWTEVRARLRGET